LGQMEKGGIRVRYTPIRKIQLVIDVEDHLAPVLTLKDFQKLFNTDPAPPRYRVVSIEVLTCPEDGYVILPSECAECPRFIRRIRDVICCYETPVKTE